MTFSRYAVFFTLSDGPLARFGHSWLGWDIVLGREVPHPVASGLPRPVSDITESPRKYGLHATLKPPFKLAAGQSAEALFAAVDGLAGQLTPVTLDGLQLAAMGRFLAAVPVGDQTQLNQLAAMTVEHLDSFRAPLTEEDLARRTRPGLSARHTALLRRWGYPYVMDAFRFHITLTGKLDKADLNAVRAHLSTVLAPYLNAPFPVDALSLVGEDAETGRFHLIHRFAFHA